MSRFINRIDKNTGEEKMKNLIMLTLLLFVAVGCKSEAVEVVPVEESVEVTE